MDENKSKGLISGSKHKSPRRDTIKVYLLKVESFNNTLDVRVMKAYLLKVESFNYSVNMSQNPIAEFVNPYYLNNFNYRDARYGLFLFRSNSCEERNFLHNLFREEVLMLPAAPTQSLPDEFLCDEDEEIPYLPVELVTNILLRLPEKLLLCCRPVCKVWCKIIDSPCFANAHLTRCVPKESELVLLEVPNFPRRDIMRVSLLKVESFNCTVNMSHNPIAEFVNPYYYLDFNYNDALSNYIGYGLFLFRNNNCEEKIFLYNPFREEVLMLPPASAQPWPYDFSHGDVMINSFCLGFDNATNEYKIVHTYNVKFKGTVKDVSNSVVTEIYTLGTSSWRKINFVPPAIPGPDVVPAYGDIHWKILSTFSVSKSREKLLSFDLKKEEYKLTNLPELHGFVDFWVDFVLFNLKDFLAVSDVIDIRMIDIWILKDYENQEWVKQYSINHDEVSCLFVLGGWQDGVILITITEEYHTQMFYYDPETDTMVKSSNLYDGWIITCPTSLVSLKNYGDLMAKKASPGCGTYCFELDRANT